ncbi:MAG: ZIP family metal transporter, partial [Owenweeksia sp.]
MLNYLYLIASVALGSLIAAMIRNPKTRPVKMLLTFSGAYLLSIGVFHLIPEIYKGGNGEIGLFIMGGFFLQLILEFFSKGVEH